MKVFVCSVIALAAAPAAMLAAQSQPAGAPASGDPATVTTAQLAAIQRLSFMDGEWRGTAVTQTARGERRVTQTERIGSMLGGTIKVIEGRGFATGSDVAFDAFAVLSYDPQKQGYEFRSYAQGYAGTFPFEAIPTGYVWSTPAAGGSVRYTATITSTTWNEVGDLIAGDKPPVRIFEMNLKRIGDTKWPEAGALTPD